MMIGLPAPRRPKMPPGYGVGDPQYGFEPIEWRWVEERLEAARSYWVAAARADGSPHAVPVWGVWFNGAFHFFTDPASLKARSLAADPRAVVHLESGDDVVILEGMMESCRPTTALLQAYEAKYGVSPESVAAVLFRLNRAKTLAWREQDFPRSATRWA